MEEVLLRFVPDLREGQVQQVADVVADTGGETFPDGGIEGRPDAFVGRLPEEFNRFEAKEVLLIEGQTLLFEEGLTEQQVKDVVNFVLDPESDSQVRFTTGTETSNAIVNAFNDFQNGDFREVTAEDVIDEAFA